MRENQHTQAFHFAFFSFLCKEKKVCLWIEKGRTPPSFHTYALWFRYDTTPLMWINEPHFRAVKFNETRWEIYKSWGVYFQRELFLMQDVRYNKRKLTSDDARIAVIYSQGNMMELQREVFLFSVHPGFWRWNETRFVKKLLLYRCSISTKPNPLPLVRTVNSAWAVNSQKIREESWAAPIHYLWNFSRQFKKNYSENVKIKSNAKRSLRLSHPRTSV